MVKKYLILSGLVLVILTLVASVIAINVQARNAGLWCPCHEKIRGMNDEDITF